MQFEFGYNNTRCLKYILTQLKKKCLYIETFYTGVDFVGNARLTGASSKEEICIQKKLINQYNSASKLYLVMNDTVVFESENRIAKISKELDYLVKEKAFNGVIIANPMLLAGLKKILQKNKIEVVISTILNIVTIEQLKQLEVQCDFFTSLVAPISLNRNLKMLRKLKKEMKGKKLILIPNEPCMPWCINRRFHFNAHSIHDKEQSDFFVKRCSEQIKNDPTLLLKSGVILPSMMRYGYSEIVDCIKMPTRHLSDFNKIDAALELCKMYSESINPMNYFQVMGKENKYSLYIEDMNDIMKEWGNCENNCSSCNLCDNFKSKIQIKKV